MVMEEIEKKSLELIFARVLLQLKKEKALWLLKL